MDLLVPGTKGRGRAAMGVSGVLVLGLALLLPCCCLSALTPRKARSPSFVELRTIKDLRNIEPGHIFPRHGLFLLYYLAANVRVDQNNVIRTNIRPDRQDVGFHYYGDREGVFPPLPDQNRMAYYSLGNVNSGGSSQLPVEVTWNSDQQPWNRESNRDRIVLSYRRDSRTVNDVYITQHYANSWSFYDGDNTYRVTPDLLLEIQNLIQTTDNSLQVFLFEAGYRDNIYTSTCRAIPRSSSRYSRGSGIIEPSEASDPFGGCGKITLEVKTSAKGYAVVKWDGLPVHLLESDVQLKLISHSEEVRSVNVDLHSYGAVTTGEAMNSGLWVKLVEADGSLIMGSPTTDDADRKSPVDVDGYDASLQMFTKGGWAGARLYVRKTFTSWKDVFYYSWVGFYNCKYDDGGDLLYMEPRGQDYCTYQWVTKFQKEDDTNSEYNIYSYLTNMYIQPMATAKFFLDSGYTSPLASTAPWET